MPLNAEGIPADLKATPQWCGWKWQWNGKDAKWDKPPFSIATRRKCNGGDLADLSDFAKAMAAHRARRFDGVGFRFRPDDPYAGIDLDGCRNPETGAIAPWAQHWIDRFATYTEVSPSGKGVKLFCRGKISGKGKNRRLQDGAGVEIYSAGRYFTVTGNKLADSPSTTADAQAAIDELIAAYWVPESTTTTSASPSRNGHHDVLDRARKYLAKVPPAISGQGGHNATYHAACVLAHGFALSAEEAKPLLLEWNTTCQPPWSAEELDHKLADAAQAEGPRGELLHEHDPPRGHHRGNGHAGRPADATKENGEDDDPGRVKLLADAICLTAHFAQDAGGRLYHCKNGVFRPDGASYVKRRVKALLIEWGETKKWSTKLANEVIEFVGVDAPELPDRPRKDLVNVENGMVRVEDGMLLPHDPKYLSMVQLPVKYDRAAACPNIEAFVASTFPSDAHALAWEIPGVLMVPATWLQKAVLLLGEGNNGKSTWLSLLVRFLGKHNVTSKSLHKLEADKFAVARLVGKLANICPDLPSEHLAGTSVFKALTGEDSQVDAEYKFKDSFDMEPFARLVFSANYPPRSSDSSAAFFRRWLVVPFDHTFGPDEQIPKDILDGRLQSPGELSGLLNKALDGLRRVQRQRRFSEPESTKAAWRDFHSTTDPLAVWLDRYTIDDADCYVTKQALRVAYNAAVERDGRPAMTAKAFGQAIYKLRPNVEEAQRTVGGKYQWCYLGIGLASQAGDAPDARDARDHSLSFTHESEETERGKGDSRKKIIEGNPVHPVHPVDCSHQDVAETPTHDGYVNRQCRDCGQNLGCRKAEPQA
jgi:putative DNA primase/helicase